ncbi:MAG: hypothetical protein KKH92_09695, partial [Firmicutes bacterium]|nr:hypothetical protein [Bacillota bacterium]
VGSRFVWDVDGFTMPAQDLVVNGDYEKHLYYITYFLDGVYYGMQSYTYEDEITYLVPTIPDGMVFSGWDVDYELMPADHIEARGTTAVQPAS